MRELCSLALATLIAVNCTASGLVMSVCDLSKDYRRFGDKLVAVRGVYYYGLREKCTEKCSSGIWPSFIDLEGKAEPKWRGRTSRKRNARSKLRLNGRAKRFEIWVTVTGRLLTRSSFWDKGAQCEWAKNGLGFGHLGSFPAQIQVEGFSNIEVKQNPKSPYDYANMYHGAM